MSQDDKPSEELLVAGDAFRQTMIPRADLMRDGYYPMWHGWALMDAFIAGAQYATASSARPQEPRTQADVDAMSAVEAMKYAQRESPDVVCDDPLYVLAMKHAEELDRLRSAPYSWARKDAADSAKLSQEGYPGIAHDFETMRAALVQIRDECFNGYAHDIAEAALNAAPGASIHDVLFDSYTVYKELRSSEASGLSIPAEAVAEVLDAAVRLIRRAEGRDA